MPARDLYHNAFVRALLKDGWNITDDPLIVPFGSRDVLIDIGAERLLAAERNGERIAVEIKSLRGSSPIGDLEMMLGEFVLYEAALKRSSHADHVLYMAVRQEVYDDLFVERIGKIIVDSHKIRLIVFDAETEEIQQWIP